VKRTTGSPSSSRAEQVGNATCNQPKAHFKATETAPLQLFVVDETMEQEEFPGGEQPAFQQLAPIISLV